MKKLFTVTALLLSSYLLTAQNNFVESISNEPSKVIIPLSQWVNCTNGIYYFEEQTSILTKEKAFLTKNVGIGITNPIYKLHAAGDIYANGGWLRVSGTKGLLFQSYGGGFYMTDATWIRTYNNKSFYHNSGIMRTDGTFQVGSSGSRFLVNTTGNVGIGTTSPDFKLQVENNVAGDGGWTSGINLKSINATTGEAAISFNNVATSANHWIMGLNQSNKFGIAYGSSFTNTYTKFTIDTDGNVGIGISTPTKKLDVSGDINYTGNLYKKGVLVDFSGEGSSSWTQSGSNIYYNTGNVGIGVSDPGDAKLWVAGKFTVSGYSTGDMVSIVNKQADLPENTDLIWGSFGWTSQPNNPRLLHLNNSGSPRFVVRNNGQVGVNCDPGNSTYKLTVNGAILCEKVKCISDVPFADYVFDEDYQLLSINKLDEFVKEYKHLPEIPTAQDVKEEGIDVIELEVLLLKKVEELSLYTIQLYKKIAELEAQIKTTE